MIARELAYVAAILAAGWAVLAVAAPGRRPAVEWLAAVAALGCGATGTLLTWASLSGARPSVPLLACLAAAALAVIALRGRAALPARAIRGDDEATPARKPCVVVAAVVVAAALGIVALDAVVFPVAEWDAFAIWQLKAKLFAHASLPAARAALSDPTLSYAHARYPPMVPMLSAGAYAAAGGTDDDRASRVYLPLLAGAAVGFVYAAGRGAALGRGRAAAVAALLAASPALVRWGGRGTADLPLAAFYAGAVLYAARWLEHRRDGDLRLAAVLGAFVALTKNEGMAIAAVDAAVLALATAGPARRRRLRVAGWAVAAAALVAGPWLAYARTLPATDENYLARVRPDVVLADAGRLGRIVGAMSAAAADPTRWGVFWWLLPLAAAVGFRALRRRPVIAVWAMLAGQLGVYAFAYVVTPLDLNWVLNASLTRLLLQASPAAAMLIAWHWASARRRSEVAGTSGASSSSSWRSAPVPSPGTPGEG